MYWCNCKYRAWSERTDALIEALEMSGMSTTDAAKKCGAFDRVPPAEKRDRKCPECDRLGLYERSEA